MSTSLDILNKLREGVDYSNNIDIFNQILTEWDFIGDVTEPYVSHIKVDDYNITISCEMWDPDLDDYVSCDAGEHASPKIVKMLEEADFDHAFNVYEVARPIYVALSLLVDWDKVYNKLQEELDWQLHMDEYINPVHEE